MHAMINPYIVTCSGCSLTMRSECVWAFGEGSNFQLQGLKLSFKVFSSRRSSLTPTFVESCADFEVAHYILSILRPSVFAAKKSWVDLTYLR